MSSLSNNPLPIKHLFNDGEIDDERRLQIRERVRQGYVFSSQLGENKNRYGLGYRLTKADWKRVT